MTAAARINHHAHCGTRDGVCARVLISIVNDTRSTESTFVSVRRKEPFVQTCLRVRSVRAREGDEPRGWERGARARHLDLDARRVELRPGVRERGVQRDASGVRPARLASEITADASPANCYSHLVTHDVLARLELRGDGERVDGV